MGSKEEGLGAPEIWDDEATMKKNIQETAKIMKNSKHCVFYTGAGISTAAGIPDFRGPNGVWTQKAKGITIPRRMEKIILPTFTHMAILKLIDLGYVKFLTSQNVDGLHLTSGVSEDKIAELHGNTHMERCKLCKQKILRDFYVRVGKAGKHDTFRDCPKCGGKKCLYDSIIDFGDNLPEDALNAADYHSRVSDAAIVLGTSLRVSPACSFPIKCKKIDPVNNKLVIVNAQETPYDHKADIVAHSKTDDFMAGICKELGITPDNFIYKKELELEICGKKTTSKKDPTSEKPPTESLALSSFLLKSSILGGSVTTDVKDLNFNLVLEQDEKSDKGDEKQPEILKFDEYLALEPKTDTRIFELNTDLKFKKSQISKDCYIFVEKAPKIGEKQTNRVKFLKFYISFGFKATKDKNNNEIEFYLPLKDLEKAISKNSKFTVKFDYKTNTTTGDKELVFKS